MKIDLPITFIPPGAPVQGTVTVEFTEAKQPGLTYYTRELNEKTIAWPHAFPEDQKTLCLKPLYHLLNKERQKVVLDDAFVKP